MSSRFVVGLGAWVLGVATATTGSMFAVNDMAHGLLNGQAQQVAGSTVNADFDHGADQKHSAPAVSATPKTPARTPAPRVTHSVSPSAAPAASPTPAQSSAPPPSSTGKLLVSADGSVMATCKSAGAYLIYWSPDQGFETDDVVRGPAAVASVVFENRSSGLVMQVSCSGGKPILNVSHDD